MSLSAYNVDPTRLDSLLLALRFYPKENGVCECSLDSHDGVTHCALHTTAKHDAQAQRDKEERIESNILQKRQDKGILKSNI